MQSEGTYMVRDVFKDWQCGQSVHVLIPGILYQRLQTKSHISDKQRALVNETSTQDGRANRAEEAALEVERVPTVEIYGECALLLEVGVGCGIEAKPICVAQLIARKVRNGSAVHKKQGGVSK